ncbi:hypothetical protein ACLOJK_014391 [Asimina triloba]
MEEDMENGSNRVYRGEWTSEMPRWIGWPSDVSPPAKHISNDGSSASDDSTVFNETKQISAPPLQLHHFTGSSPLWGHDFLMRGSSLSYDPRLDDRTNIDMNMIKREHPSYDFDCQFQPAAAAAAAAAGLPLISLKAPQMPAMFPAGTAVAAGEEEGQISKSLSSSSCKPPLASGSHSSNQLLFYSNNLPFWKANPEMPSAKRNSAEGPPRQEKPSCGNVAQIKVESFSGKNYLVSFFSSCS